MKRTNIRFDAIKMPKMFKTKEGYLRGEAVVSRAGVFKYRNIDGSMRGELRHPEDIFKTDSLETLKMIPITNNHPPEFIDASNVHKYQVGYTGESYNVIDDKVTVSMTVTHLDAIEAICAGKLELSMGYDVSLIEEDGVYQEERYDFRQLEPQYNHLAIVAKGRAGSEARFRFDDACELVEIIEAESVEPEPDEINLLINKPTKDISEEMDKNMNTEHAVKNNQTLATLSEENKQLATKISNLQARLDSAEEALRKAEESEGTSDATDLVQAEALIEKKVMDRVALLSKAAPFLKDASNYHKHSDRAIMEAAINAMRTDAIDFKDHSDDYVKGVFDNFVASKPGKQARFDNGLFNVIAHNCDDANGASTLHSLLASRAMESLHKMQYGDR